MRTLGNPFLNGESRRRSDHAAVRSASALLVGTVPYHSGEQQRVTARIGRRRRS
ncbi:hypothetical protein L083_2691 [Actinoplanes sp. N902-109]|nr:hypothetical protein L083_2691 [Actinoplanes sp. N902-109]